MRRLLALAVCLAAVPLLAAGCGSAGLGQGQGPLDTIPAKDRKAAPAFSVPALNGDGQVSLAAFRGTPVVLNFWASWCDPCKRETPALVSWARAHPGVDLVGLATTDKPSDSRAFAKAKGVTYPLGIDRKGEVGNRFAIAGLPTTVIVDRAGRVAQTVSGPVTGAELDRIITRLDA